MIRQERTSKAFLLVSLLHFLAISAATSTANAAPGDQLTIETHGYTTSVPAASGPIWIPVFVDSPTLIDSVTQTQITVTVGAKKPQSMNVGDGSTIASGVTAKLVYLFSRFSEACPATLTEAAPIFSAPPGPSPKFASRYKTCMFMCNASGTCGPAPAVDLGAGPVKLLVTPHVDEISTEGHHQLILGLDGFELSFGGVVAQWTALPTNPHPALASLDVYFIPDRPVQERRYQDRLVDRDMAGLLRKISDASCVTAPSSWSSAEAQLHADEFSLLVNGTPTTSKLRPLHAEGQLRICPELDEKTNQLLSASLSPSGPAPQPTSGTGNGPAPTPRGLEIEVSFKQHPALRLSVRFYRGLDPSDAYLTNSSFARIDSFDANEQLKDWAKGLCLEIPPENVGDEVEDISAINVVDREGRIVASFGTGPRKLLRRDTRMVGGTNRAISCASLTFAGAPNVNYVLQASAYGSGSPDEDLQVYFDGFPMPSKSTPKTLRVFGPTAVEELSYISAGVLSGSISGTTNIPSSLFVVRAHGPLVGASLFLWGAKAGISVDTGFSFGLAFGSKDAQNATGLNGGGYVNLCVRLPTGLGGRLCAGLVADEYVLFSEGSGASTGHRIGWLGTIGAGH